MAEVDTSMYRNLQPQDPLKTPMAIMQLLGQVNQNRLFNQTYDARQSVGAATKAAIGPDGKFDLPTFMKTLSASGPNFLAPEAAGQAVSNATNQFSLDSAKLSSAQKMIAAVAADPNAKKSDYARAATALGAAGVDPAMITSLTDPIYAAKNPKEMRDIALKHGIMSLGTGALEGEAGPPNEEGQIPQIPKGQAIPQRAAPGGMVTTNPPGYNEAAVGSAGVMNAARARAANYGSDVFPMTQLLTNLEKLGPQGTGPGTHEFNTMKSFVQSNLNWLPGADKIIGDPNKIADYNEAEKYATQLAGSRASQFGHGTDQAMAQSLIGSPNTHISNLAGVNLTKAVIGLRRMEHAQTLEADAKGVNPGKFATWAARWATDVDPRAFMDDLMTPEQKQRLSASIKNPAERAKYNQSVQKAIDLGIITRPGGQRTPGE